jgi:DNA replication protein DnaC
MLIHPTVERLRSLGLAAMADTLVEMQNNPEAAEMPHADWLGLLIDREATFRDNRRLARRLTAAKLRQTATIENIDYRTARGLDRALLPRLDILPRRCGPRSRFAWEQGLARRRSHDLW